MTTLRKPGIAVVGLGFGKHIVKEQLLHGPGQPYFTITGVCDINSQRATELARTLSLRTYASLDEILGDKQVEVVGLFTGPVGRAELIRKIIRAGRHVMTTKPFEIDPQAALSVLAEARSLGLAVHLNSPTPKLSADFEHIKRWQQEFDLGRAVAGRTETWASYREKPDGSWYDDPKLCPVAPVLRLGIYGINDLIVLLGKPVSVFSMHSRLFTGRPTPDNAQVAIRFESGSIATVFASFCIDDGLPYADRVTINYENGTVQKMTVLDPDGQRSLVLKLLHNRTGKPVQEIHFPAGSLHSYQWDVLHQSVLGDHRMEEDVMTRIVTGVEVIQAMGRSAHSGMLENIAN